MGSDALIANPVLNSPFAEPTRHFRFTEDDRRVADPLPLVLEESGAKDSATTLPLATARDLWLPAVNADGSHSGSAKSEIRELLTKTGRSA